MNVENVTSSLDVGDNIGLILHYMVDALAIL
jgi:hypothetical protein